ncbi:MAG: PHP domain-containing protein [archaeon]
MINLHTHTRYSDGGMPMRTLVGRAVEEGISVLAITDHYEYFLGFRHCRSLRMLHKLLIHVKEKGISYCSDISSYFRKIDALNGIYPINILAGLEVDLGTLRLTRRAVSAFSKCGLVLVENVRTEKDLMWLSWMRCLLPEHVCLAHPWLRGFDRDYLLDFLESHNIGLEMNTAWHYGNSLSCGKGFLFEAQEEIYRGMRGRRIPLFIGSDAHRKSEPLDTGATQRFIRAWGLEKNVIFK